jgi:hypothetical protein
MTASGMVTSRFQNASLLLVRCWEKANVLVKGEMVFRCQFSHRGMKSLTVILGLLKTDLLAGQEGSAQPLPRFLVSVDSKEFKNRVNHLVSILNTYEKLGSVDSKWISWVREFGEVIDEGPAGKRIAFDERQFAGLKTKKRELGSRIPNWLYLSNTIPNG